jgi:hypothetical protein
MSLNTSVESDTGNAQSFVVIYYNINDLPVITVNMKDTPCCFNTEAINLALRSAGSIQKQPLCNDPSGVCCQVVCCLGCWVGIYFGITCSCC